jgi:hypothetical protein
MALAILTRTVERLKAQVAAARPAAPRDDVLAQDAALRVWHAERLRPWGAVARAFFNGVGKPHSQTAARLHCFDSACALEANDPPPAGLQERMREQSGIWLFWELSYTASHLDAGRRVLWLSWRDEILAAPGRACPWAEAAGPLLALAQAARLAGNLSVPPCLDADLRRLVESVVPEFGESGSSFYREGG